MELKRPDKPSRCTWKPNATNTPHTQRTECYDRNKIIPDILNVIGQTPMVRLNNIPRIYNVKCEMFVKCEFLNPGGSVKDRIGHRMIVDAEAKGLLKPGYTIIEPTSGNTGIGLAMAAAVKGYKCIIVMPEKMSNEKLYTLHALGAKVVRTPTEAAWADPDSHISVAQKLQKEIPNSIILDQYTHSGNPLAHYDRTGAEIWQQCDGKVDYVVAGAGTSGTISGIGRKLKELSPSTKIIAVDPEGSILAQPDELNKSDTTFYEVEGIGYDFIPTVSDRNVIDRWIKSKDKESLIAARMLIREEGLLCGGSSGAALSAALQIAKDLSADKRMVVLLPDGIRNYMTKFVSDHWMITRGYMDLPEPIESNKWWWNLPVSTLPLNKSLISVGSTTCAEAVNILKHGSKDHLIVTEDQKRIKGLVTMNSILTKLISSEAKESDFAEKALIKQYPKVTTWTPLGKISYILEKEPYAVVLDDTNDNAVAGTITQYDLFVFVSKGNVSQTKNETR